MNIDKREQWKVQIINEDIIKCSKCKKNHIGTIDNISTKNPNYYLKTCKKCREYFTEYMKKKYTKKKLEVLVK